MATTDANGRASFRWTPGTSPSNQLRIFVEGAPESTSLAIQAGTSVIIASSVVNPATSASGIAPGTLATIYGANLAAGTRAAAPFPWPASISGVGVQLNGQPAPVLYVSDQQVNFLVPTSFIERQARTGCIERSGHFHGLFGRRCPRSLRDLLRRKHWLRSDSEQRIASKHLGSARARAESSWRSTVPDWELPGTSRTICNARLACRKWGSAVFRQESPIAAWRRAILGLYQVNVQVPDLAPSGAVPLVLSLNGSRSNEVRIGIE